MKNRIEITKKNDQLNFYLVTGEKKIYLFSQEYSKGVYHFFQSGRSESELHKYKLWRKNPRLDKTIEKIPMYVRYALKENFAA